MKGPQQFILYAGIGLFGTAGHYAMLVFLVQLLEVSPIIATTVGFVIGATINYLLNYHITFSSKKRHGEAFTRFFLVALAGAIINLLIMMAGMKLLHVHYLMIQIFATAMVLLFNFLLNRRWTFADN
jgi:putative flippase GtrA